MSAETDENGFLARWSRRKLQAEDAVEARDDVQGEDDALAIDEAQAQALAEAQALGEDDVARLTPDSDFTVFMRQGVAPHIKRMALRKLWTSSPILANLDGLNDYEGDFTGAAQTMQQVATSWSMGKGYLSGDDNEDMSTAVETAQVDVAEGPAHEDEPQGNDAASGEIGESLDS